MTFISRSKTRNTIKLASLAIACITGIGSSFAQTQTVGLFLNETESFDGYTLFAPTRSGTTYLIDNAGHQVQSWESQFNPGLAVYLLANGHLLRTANTGGNPTINAGGAGGAVEEFTWDGTLLWSFEYSNSQYRLHHDIEYLPNGNVLMIAWENKTVTEAIEAGRNPDYLADGALWPDHIIEIQPDGASGGSIVWEWHVWDHLIQDYDPSMENYDVVAEHPELVDLNYAASSNQLNHADWNHINGIDYNATFDQIILSVHNFSEIWIIDHSTTVAEAAGHQGGNSSHGGDLLYRWGNPQAYDAGSINDRLLFAQHDAQWIEDDMPGAGNILIYNNGLGRPAGTYSTVDEITSPVDEEGNYTMPSPGEAYGPVAQAWVYQAENPTDFFSANISGASRMPNGNTLICEGSNGRFFEVSPESGIVWEYVNPVVAAGPMTQGNPIPAGPNGQENNVFKIWRYAGDYSGFDGVDLSPGDLIELPDEIVEEFNYQIVDTGQLECYDNADTIDPPQASEAFFGQDAQNAGHQPSYTDNVDGTISDDISGLMWQSSPDLNNDGTIDVNDKLSYYDALSGADSFDLAGHTDWRLPTIKELYSLILFKGKDISGPNPTLFIPFIDTDYFEFGYGDEAAGERLIDAQYVSSTLYVGTTMMNDETVFGVNFADGRIKGYPLVMGQTGEDKLFYVSYVRGNESYGINDFVDNADGTISDNASGLMWQQDDSAQGLNWEAALALAQQKNVENYLGYDDWRLPDAKELQSLIDYTRSLQTTGSAAIDPLFTCSTITDEGGADNYPFYWSSSTHANEANGNNAAYVCFGEALGWMEMPPGSGNYNLLDVHGAGAQRSDPKMGDPADYPYGHGPQGDVIRIFNHVRLVRDTGNTGINENHPGSSVLPDKLKLFQNYPNPFNPSTNISFRLTEPELVTLNIYDISGRLLKNLLNTNLSAGSHSVRWDSKDESGKTLAAGVYFYKLSAGENSSTKKMLLIK
jgi:hypothetical protein